MIKKKLIDRNNSHNDNDDGNKDKEIIIAIHNKIRFKMNV